MKLPNNFTPTELLVLVKYAMENKQPVTIARTGGEALWVRK